ncbi:YcxB family protein [Bacillus vallismortis]|uniref:YcxB family protein n=1 Tax=Bacillus vallismortis TaxID=72361 RepID=UPI0020915D6D|nr:YcxB family protein [Bacillus vallismortis]MCO4852022.1 YcxB family protein [Bacillus vallismortis]
MIQYASESINLPGEITFKDVREIFFYQIGKLSCFYFLLFCAIFAAINFINGWPRLVYGSDALNLFVNGSLIIIMSVLFTLLILLLLYVKFSKAYKKNERIKSKRTYTLNQEGIRICSKKYDLIFHWNEITSVFEYKNVFRVNTSSSQYIAIPKHFFHSKEEMNRFRGIILDHTETKKVKFKKDQR